MLIYSSAASPRQLRPCNGEGAKDSASTRFSNSPQAGIGPWVYVADVPEATLNRYEIHAAFAPEGMRYFSLPASEVDSLDLQEFSFQELTGRDWRSLYVTLRDPKVDRSTQAWSQVWTSRAGVVILRNRTMVPQEMVTLQLTPLFDPSKDYVLVERQMYGGNKWDLYLLAGTAPMWADFPNQWQQWATNSEIIQSAVSHILSVIPETRELVEEAVEKKMKFERIEAWRRVAQKAGEILHRDLGVIQAHSMTSAMAMPMRIAQRIGAWTPPVPKPEFEDPKLSGRFLLAAPELGMPEVGCNRLPFESNRPVSSEHSSRVATGAY